MIKSKRGSYIQITSAIFGSILVLIGLYFINEKNFVYGGIMGIIGILLITISVLPFIKGSSK